MSDTQSFADAVNAKLSYPHFRNHPYATQPEKETCNVCGGTIQLNSMGKPYGSRAEVVAKIVELHTAALRAELEAYVADIKTTPGRYARTNNSLDELLEDRIAALTNPNSKGETE